MEWFEPMEPISRPDVINDAGWIHQVKWDGIRGLCYITGRNLSIFTKSGRERTKYYPELSVLPGLLNCTDAVIDGEMIVLDEDTKPSFYLSLSRERVKDERQIEAASKKYPVTYVAFDILSRQGKTLTSVPLAQRRLILKETLGPDGNIAITDDFKDGAALFDLMKKKGWEGIVSKRLSSFYLKGKNHNDWYKTKLSRKMLAIVCGVMFKQEHPNSLLLGIMREDGIKYIGRASIGLTQENLKMLGKAAVLQSGKKPFEINLSEFKNAKWLEHFITCWVSFLEWTNDGGLRHPRIIGFSGATPSEADGKEFIE